MQFQSTTNKSLIPLLVVFIMTFFTNPVAAQFGNIFQQMFNQQHEQVEKTFFNTECDKYLCPDTLSCVSRPVDCPCPFPDSQLKCVLPDKKNFVCISAPAPGDKNPRDCSFVNKAYKGTV